MLILKINEETEKIKRIKGVFRKKIIYEEATDIKRYSISINGKNAIALELPYKEIENEDVLSLLKIYKGRVLVAEEYYNNRMLKDYLFVPKAYCQRAILSSFKNQLITVGRDWKNVCVKTTDFVPFQELFQIVKKSKALTLITEKSVLTDKFLEECYYELGAIVSVKEACPAKTDVYLDLDMIDAKGRLMINSGGRDYILYPDAMYFDDNEEYHKLSSFNIDHNKIQAAFSDK